MIRDTLYFGKLKIKTQPECLEIELPRIAKTGRKKQKETARNVPMNARKVVKVADQSGGESTGAGKAKIQWPKSNSKEWPRLDEGLTALLKILSIFTTRTTSGISS